MQGQLDTLVDFTKSGKLKGQEFVEDPEALVQAHIHALTGGLLALGLKFAGTRNENAQKILIQHIKIFMKAKLHAPDPFLGKTCFQKFIFADLRNRSYHFVFCTPFSERLELKICMQALVENFLCSQVMIVSQGNRSPFISWFCVF